MTRKKPAPQALPLVDLESSYRATAPLAERFADELTHQIDRLLKVEDISLGFPIQRRLKEWVSIVEKLKRRALQLEQITDLSDLVGLRVILQFRRDVERVCALLEQHFNVVERDDTAERLQADQFGYSSIHFVIELPPAWLTVPTLSGMGGLRAEVQVRTIAQHLWAATSHTLQYKHEGDVPVPVRRAIHRVSALLETVDLELERVLTDRASYQADRMDSGSDLLGNVDDLQAFLNEALPAENRKPYENYSELLSELKDFDITSTDQLREIFAKHLPVVLKEDRGKADELKKPAFYSHAGLVRRSLSAEFGRRYDDYLVKRYHKKTEPHAE